MVARGMVGPNGRIGMVDSEAGRGEIYSDVIPGGYDVMQLSSPFSPSCYIASIEAAEAAKYDILITDSGSHEWEGLGGVLDMASEIEEKSGKSGLHCWKKPKLEHAKFVLKLLQSRLPIIVCLRAKFKSRQGKNERTGKAEIIKDDFVTPIQADDFIFEMTAHAEILQDHTIRLTKCSHPDLRSCFPEDFKEPLAIKHGEAIARWCASPGRSPVVPTATTSKPKSPTRDQLRADIWGRAKAHFKDVEAFESVLFGEGFLGEGQRLSALSDEQLAKVCAWTLETYEAKF